MPACVSGPDELLALCCFVLLCAALCRSVLCAFAEWNLFYVPSLDERCGIFALCVINFLLCALSNHWVFALCSIKSAGDCMNSDSNGRDVIIWNVVSML